MKRRLRHARRLVRWIYRYYRYGTYRHFQGWRYLPIQNNLSVLFTGQGFFAGAQEPDRPIYELEYV